MKIIYFLALCATVLAFPSYAQEMITMKLSSPSFTDGEMIPPQFTCQGEDKSPELVWDEAPAETKSFVLIVDDPDAPHGTWVHWVVYNIPAGVNRLPEGTKEFPKLGTQGTSSFKDKKDYGGPCPPSGTHRYFFKLYALNDILKLPNGASKADVEAAMEKHIIAQATLMGRYAQY